MKRGALYFLISEMTLILVTWFRVFGRATVEVDIIGLLYVIILFSIFLLSFMKEDEDRRPFCWNMGIVLTSVISIIVLFANLYRYTGLNDGHGKTQEIFDCVYFSTITLTTVGYGDLTPTPGLARLVASCEALAGYITLGTLVAAIGFIAKPRSASRREKGEN